MGLREKPAAWQCVMFYFREAVRWRNLAGVRVNFCIDSRVTSPVGNADHGGRGYSVFLSSLS